MAHVHLIVGPVGAGKSTLARRLQQQHRAAWLNLDEWMIYLFRDDRPPTGVIEWYAERAERCVEQIWRVARGMLEMEVDVVLELGLIQRAERAAFTWRLDREQVAWTLYVVYAPRALRRARVEQRNRERGDTFTMEVPAAVFEMASDMWEPVSAQECGGRDVRFISTDSPAG